MNPRVAAVLAVAAACSPKMSAEKPAAPEPAYVMQHQPHIDADIACTTCHPMNEAKKLEGPIRHVKLPKDVTKTSPCSDCHDKPLAVKLPLRTTPFRLRFDHAAHLPRVNGKCQTCHASPPEKGDAVAKAPPMSACTGCHKHQQDFVEARCIPCHVDLKGLVAEGTFKHSGEWLRQHAALAHASGESCAACHDQTYCVGCHSPTTAAAKPSIIWPERVDRTYIHRGDYVGRHMIDAGAAPQSCRRCHGSAFCEDCHTQQGLTKFAEAFRRPTSHDQPGWAIGSGSAKPAHASAARRDISSCAGCHDQGAQATCVGCHQVGGLAGSTAPHPKKFLSAHDAEDRKHNAMCAACHHGQ